MSRITVPLTLRQRAIILHILRGHERVTHEQLAQATGLSVRVVRYNMRAVRAWFATQNIRLDSRPGLGIEIQAASPVRRKLVSALGHSVDQDLVLTGVQRRRAFLFQLLASDSPQSFQSLAAQVGSSRSSVIHDVGRMQVWLGRYEIELARRPKRGISLNAHEHMRRFAILGILQEELGDERWAAIGESAGEALAQDRSLPVYISKYLKSLDVQFSAQLMLKLENNITRHLTPNSHATILMYLAVTMQALKTRSLRPAEEPEHVVRTPEYRVAQILMKEVSQHLALTIPQSEAALLAACLLGSEWQQAAIGAVHQLMPAEEPSAEGLEYSREIVSACASQLHPLLKIDRELTYGLALHLEPAVHRLRHGIPLSNPLLDTVRSRYAEVHRSAQHAVGQLEERLGIQFSEDELAYVTMYLAAALERIGTNRRFVRPAVLVGDGNRAKITLLRSRLEYELPNMEIVGIAESPRAATGDLPRCELMISLVPYKHPQIPSVQVSPFLTGEDIRSIRNWVTAKEAQERRSALSQHTKLGIVELLDPSSVIFHSTAIDWRASVALAAEPLLRSGKIGPSYVEAMIHIVEEFGPYMILAPGVILLHAKPSDGVNSLCFSLLVHRDGIDFGGDLGRVYVVFVLGAVDNQSHLTALFQLSSLIQNPGFVRKMRQATHAADALRTIWSYLTAVDAPAKSTASRNLATP